jgi:uncharacterized delta-60 repeat protein
MIIQNNGKIIIGGGFTSCNGITRNRIARLNADGTLDSTFDPSIGANNDIIDIAIQNDGKILICGVFSSFNDVSRNRFARLNSDGSLDLSFNPGSGLDNSVSTVLLQNDGKIIIGGFFNSYNGITIRKIARLNTDASLDTTFNPGTSANQNIDNSLIQSDGKIIISGSFTSYNGTPRNRIARLNTDGSIDFSFSPSSGANGIIFSTSIQSDGKIIISGLFSSYDEFSASGIARLNTDGTLDSTFNTGTGASTDIFTTAIQNDGKIIIGGTFVSFNGTGRNRIARIQGGVSLSNSNFEKSTVVIYPNPSNGVFNIHTNTISGTKNIIVYSVIGQQVLNQELNSMETSFDISNQPKGIYFYKIFGMNNVIKRGKLVIE